MSPANASDIAQNQPDIYLNLVSLTSSCKALIVFYDPGVSFNPLQPCRRWIEKGSNGVDIMTSAILQGFIPR